MIDSHRKSWALQKAKAEFSRLVTTTLSEGPQIITKHGLPAVVVLSHAEYEQLLNRSVSFGDMLRSAPRVELNIERAADVPRSIDL